ncbi:MAG TPA: entericidin A/B family lipoprotein [Sphingomonadales bacterium]
MKKIGLMLAIALMGQMLAACNTVEGIGKDLKSGGAAIERAGRND